MLTLAGGLFCGIYNVSRNFCHKNETQVDLKQLHYVVSKNSNFTISSTVKFMEESRAK